MLLPSPILQKLPTRSNRDFETARRRLNGALWRIVTEYRADTAARDDLLSMLRDARDETGTRMSDQQLVDKAMTMLLAGTETSAYPLCGRRRHHPRQRSLSSVDLCPDQGGTWIAGTVAGRATLWNLRSFPPPPGSMW